VQPTLATALRSPHGGGGARAAALVAATSLFHLWYAGKVPLAPAEAIAWQSARHLAPSYVDQAPLAAWSVRAAIELLGTAERTVRAPAVLYGAAAAAFLFLAGRRLFGPGAALVALAAALATPLAGFGQIGATPDAPLAAAACAALYFTVRALQGGGAWLLAAGASAGVAMLADRSGWLVAVEVAAVLTAVPAGRALLRSRWPGLALLACAAVAMPVLLWPPPGVRASVPLAPPSLDRVMRFLGAQALLVTPIVGGVAWVAAFAAARRAESAFRVCAAFALPSLLLALGLAPFTAVRGSAPAVGFLVAVLAAAGFLFEAPRGRRALAAIAIGTALGASAYLHVAAADAILPFPARELPGLGWRELAGRVEAERRRLPPGAFVIGCGAAVASELAFHLPDRPRTLSSSALGDDDPQYRLWLGGEPLAGREGLLVVDRRDRQACSRRAEACAALERVRTLVPRRRGQPVTTFEVWRCRARGEAGR
jgi:4-amino-4-deoxy-L-arabinose transferase-like glycosyltransferase